MGGAARRGLSREGFGRSTFTKRMPIQCEGTTVKKILIIEDDPVARTVYQRFFQANGFTAEVASDGIKGLEQVTAFEPDVLLLDLIMPRLGGIEVIKKLRAQDAYRELPILVLTNACIPAYVDQAVQAGA